MASRVRRSIFNLLASVSVCDSHPLPAFLYLPILLLLTLISFPASFAPFLFFYFTSFPLSTMDYTSFCIFHHLPVYFLFPSLPLYYPPSSPSCRYRPHRGVLRLPLCRLRADHGASASPAEHRHHPAHRQDDRGGKTASCLSISNNISEHLAASWSSSPHFLNN